ncbi:MULTISPECIES: trypsin-like serine protease [Cysteiniphilum]|uniref:trypsin-like serine protease n=1 Tax=Cysteiniphilum TaxID=2056696 RepID=UPI0017815E4A|nr:MULTISPECIES: trypsin-like serine protease [Cysteiniphilum]
MRIVLLVSFALLEIGLGFAKGKMQAYDYLSWRQWQYDITSYNNKTLNLIFNAMVGIQTGGGDESKNNDKNKKQFCSGIALTPNKILTNYHCLYRTFENRKNNAFVDIVYQQNQQIELASTDGHNMTLMLGRDYTVALHPLLTRIAWQTYVGSNRLLNTYADLAVITIVNPDKYLHYYLAEEVDQALKFVIKDEKEIADYLLYSDNTMVIFKYQHSNVGKYAEIDSSLCQGKLVKPQIKRDLSYFSLLSNNYLSVDYQRIQIDSQGSVGYVTLEYFDEPPSFSKQASKRFGESIVVCKSNQNELQGCKILGIRSLASRVMGVNNVYRDYYSATAFSYSYGFIKNSLYQL